MKHYLDTSRYQYTVTRNAEAKTDQNGKQKFTREGAPMWQTQVQALDEDGATVLMVTTAGERPTVTVGQVVTPFGLEAIPWNQNGRNGVVYRAVELKPVHVAVSK